MSKNVVIVGDFNFPNINWINEELMKANKCSENFLNFRLSNSLKQMVRENTRRDRILDFALLKGDRNVLRAAK